MDLQENHEDSPMPENNTYHPRIADFPFEKKQEVVGTFRENWWTNAHEGDFIDALDTVNKWCLAQIL